MDTVELVMDLEEEFGVPISDEVAAEMQTPRHVIDYFEKQLAVDGEGCLTQKFFYKLRQMFVEEGLCERGEFRLDAELDELLPRGVRRVFWKKYHKHFDVYLPSLEYAPWVKWAWLLGVFPCSYGLYATGLYSPVLSLLFGAIFALITFGMFASFTRAAVQLPRRLQSPRDLIEWTCEAFPNLLGNVGETYHRDEIAEKVRKITLGYCDEKDYSEDAEFIRDLGLG